LGVLICPESVARGLFFGRKDMPAEHKIEAVDRLKEKLKRSTIVISADPTGMSVTDMTAFRRSLRKSDVEFRVIKNSLAYLAADAADKAMVKEVIHGPTGIAFGTGDPIEPAKALVEFIKSNRSPMIIRGAVLDNRVLTKADVESLASLPGRDQLLAQLAGLMLNAVTRLVYVLDAPLKGLATVLQRHADVLESGAVSNENDDFVREGSDAPADVGVEDSSPEDTEGNIDKGNKDPDDGEEGTSPDIGGEDSVGSEEVGDQEETDG